jgi:acetyltransferase EpsM
MAKEIIIVGAGGHAAELIDYIRVWNQLKKEKIEVKGLLDDNQSNHDHYNFAAPFLGSISSHNVDESAYYLMGIANIEFRKKIVLDLLEKGAKLTGFIHPSAEISPSAVIEEGVVISRNSTVGPLAKIGRHTIVNSRCTIGHDSNIGEFNFISPLCAISGNTEIGDNNLIGTNVVTVPGVKIGNGNKIGAGVVLFFEILNNITVVGQKPRIIER